MSKGISVLPDSRAKVARYSDRSMCLTTDDIFIVRSLVRADGGHRVQAAGARRTSRMDGPGGLRNGIAALEGREGSGAGAVQGLTGWERAEVGNRTSPRSERSNSAVAGAWLRRRGASGAP